jgi:hypothetical protein
MIRFVNHENAGNAVFEGFRRKICPRPLYLTDMLFNL